MGPILATASPERFYLACGIFGAAIFVVRMILMLVGADGDHGDFGHLPNDVSGEAGGDVHGDVDPGLRLLTVQGIVAFVMMFGLTGYALSHNARAGALATLLGSVAMGGATMWLLAKTFRLMALLQSSGTVSLDTAIGERGTVYLTIAPGGVGKVQVKVGAHLRVVDAVSTGKEELKTGDRIRVESALDGHTLVVTKCEPTE
ncbi:MAG: hypothetical protein GXP31_18705 [Kiritimatiellaeota bacterium]|nr:hypothetical protein [Kiritimatiellota bacterium]